MFDAKQEYPGEQDEAVHAFEQLLEPEVEYVPAPQIEQSVMLSWYEFELPASSRKVPAPQLVQDDRLEVL